MGIFDFFRKKIEKLKSERENIEEKEPAEEQAIKFEELENFVSNKKKENTEKEERTIEQITALISQLISELGEENKELKKVDLKNRKEEQRVKNIVMENLANYSSYVGKLIEGLENLKKENLRKLVNDINKIFLEFKQRSNLSFEKATFLVGRELEKVKESIRNFFEKVKEIEEQNKNIFQSSNIIFIIEKKLEEIKKLDNLKIELTREAKEIEKKMSKKETEEKILEDDIKQIKNSEEYALWEKRREEANLKKRGIEKEIFELKSEIDWKNLAKIFHTNRGKMALIKNYESHFSQILEKKGEEEIIDIIKEANIETREISEKIKDMKRKKEEVYVILNQKNKLEELASEIISIRAGTKNILSEKEKIEKRIQRVDENISEIKDDISEEIKKVGIYIRN